MVLIIEYKVINSPAEPQGGYQQTLWKRSSVQVPFLVDVDKSFVPWGIVACKFFTFWTLLQFLKY